MAWWYWVLGVIVVITIIAVIIFKSINNNSTEGSFVERFADNIKKCCRKIAKYD